MSVIYKYRVEMDLETESMYIELPIGADILSVIVEDPYTAYIYAIVDSKEKRTQKREVLWLGTGWELTEDQKMKIMDYNYLGTYKVPNSDLIWHFWIEPTKIEYDYFDFDSGKIITQSYYKKQE